MANRLPIADCQMSSEETARSQSAVPSLAFVAEIKAKAREVGFDLVGIAPAAASARRDYFRQWLDTGQAGEMAYLSRRFDERSDPAVYLPGARSVICLGINYFVPVDSPAPGHGRIARYALGQ